jgi:hypothetical protein
MDVKENYVYEINALDHWFYIKYVPEDEDPDTNVVSKYVRTMDIVSPRYRLDHAFISQFFNASKITPGKEQHVDTLDTLQHAKTKYNLSPDESNPYNHKCYVLKYYSFDEMFPYITTGVFPTFQ